MAILRSAWKLALPRSLYVYLCMYTCTLVGTGSVVASIGRQGYSSGQGQGRSRGWHCGRESALCAREQCPWDFEPCCSRLANLVKIHVYILYLHVNALSSLQYTHISMQTQSTKCAQSRVESLQNERSKKKIMVGRFSNYHRKQVAA